MSVSSSKTFIKFDPIKKVVYYEENSDWKGDYNVTIKGTVENQNLISPFVG